MNEDEKSEYCDCMKRKERTIKINFTEDPRFYLCLIGKYVYLNANDYHNAIPYKVCFFCGGMLPEEE